MPAAKKPVQAIQEAATKVKDAVTGAASDGPIPGVPGSEPPTVEEPTTPREPPPPKPDQGSPAPVSPTGAPTDLPASSRAQSGAYLTTAQGVRVRDTDQSLKAGPRGPVLLQDHHLREKIMHFDHERIPERVAHARGAAAHGVPVERGRGLADLRQLPGQGRGDAGVRALLDGHRLPRLGRHGS
jgi:catalase